MSCNPCSEEWVPPKPEFTVYNCDELVESVTAGKEFEAKVVLKVKRINIREPDKYDKTTSSITFEIEDLKKCEDQKIVMGAKDAIANFLHKNEI